VTWPEPATGSPEDAAAAQAKLDAEVGWFLDPVFKGDYPASLRAAKGAALPKFTPEQARARALRGPGGGEGCSGAPAVRAPVWPAAAAFSWELPASEGGAQRHPL
jgi:hypothetical protein